MEEKQELAQPSLHRIDEVELTVHGLLRHAHCVLEDPKRGEPRTHILHGRR